MLQKSKLLLILLFIGTHALMAQKKLPIIRANSLKVDILDDSVLTKGNWTIMPKVKPDVYETYQKNKKVTFYTDIDSISFRVKPNKKYDFIILVNNKDSALTEIIYGSQHLRTLKAAAKYNLKDKRELPKFTYQSAQDSNLIALRKTYHLDSIAGNDNEIFRILNVMHWLHNLIPHDGEKENPKMMNAKEMISICQKENRKLNCRGLAIVLNECYLSLGIKSRFVICLPKDSTDRDCHVINIVYAKSLKKWIWIDPTFDAYVMDEKGEMLGIEEVRERIINGKMLILNPDANWNHKTARTKLGYLYQYMAKNLYIIKCPLDSQFDSDTERKDKVISYLNLLPLDYPKQKPDKRESNNPKSGTTIINYRTNNPRAFWQLPE